MMLYPLIFAEYIVQFRPDANVEADIVIGNFKASLVKSKIKYRKDKRVLRIDPNVPIGLGMLDGTQVRPVWNLDRIDQRRGLDQIYKYSDNAGEGVVVYIIDSGANVKHQDLVGRITFGVDTTNEGLKDTVGHGTHVAGIIGGKTFGVAKKAELVAVKVLSSGGGTEYTFLKGLEWAVKDMQQKKKKAVANISIAAPNLKSLSDAVSEAMRLGLVVVASAGNKNADACLQSPASIPGVITVASSSFRDQISAFSNYGKCVTIFAPGENIFSADAFSNSGTVEMSGTSMAAPHVVILIYLEWGSRHLFKHGCSKY
eukprot:NODE_51_length_31136_cov_0.357670.p7 type:complete len:314 gc:universal NODE_51_length_31136_cov_0.357670:25354-26295(+)